MEKNILQVKNVCFRTFNLTQKIFISMTEQKKSEKLTKNILSNKTTVQKLTYRLNGEKGKWNYEKENI